LYRIQLCRRAAALTIGVTGAAAALALAAPAAALASPGQHHQRYPTINQVNLASDVPGLAPLTDPNLKNPWGAALTATSPLWVADQTSRSSTVYSLAAGSSAVAKSATVRVTLPDTKAGPAGLVANTTNGFVLTNGTLSAPAAFIWATLDGHIEAWSPKVDPLLGNVEDKVTVPGAVFPGLAIADTAHGERLFAADFSNDRIDVFDSAFHQVKLASWQFRDARLPKGYFPFNAQALNGNIFVAYDTINPVTHTEGTGAGIGVVDEFGTDGRFIARVATGGLLNAPWGLAIAPNGWGAISGSLLIGDFGDGRINVVARHGARYSGVSGQLVDAATGKPFAEPGLWALVPGTAAAGGTDALWFTAGINQEKDGLLGVLRP